MSGRRRASNGPRSRDDGALVTPRMDHEVLRGLDGLRTITVDGRFDSRDADGFEAEIARAELGDLTLRRTTMTPHRALVDGHGRAPADVLRLLTVQRGYLLLASPGGRPVRLDVGDAIFTCRSRAYAYQADEPVVLVAAMLPVSSLPTLVRRMEDLPAGPLRHSPLVDAVVDLLLNLATRLDEQWTFDAGYAARGLIDLETAILSELIAPQLPAPGPDRVHAAAVDYMERHLADPDLRPPQIAEALGVSLRYLHRAFDGQEMTVAKHLQERRLELVAAALRSADRPPNLLLLASRYGFATQDQLARAFRRRFGRSMTAYRDAANR